MNQIRPVKNPIYVTRPFLPPLEDYVELLGGAWETGILTHNGPLVQRLEKELVEFLGAPNMVAMTNGTVALQLAIRALDLRGEIITTPFSWIATCSAIRWEYCEPVFTDIDAATFNMDPSKIAERITDKTVAIMPVHTFGNPCDVRGIEAVAKEYGLRVIYDAAHALGTQVDGESVFNWGDISATSFHATKLFQTAEGGGCSSPDPIVAERLRRLRFFGHDADKNIIEDGCNGKMTEVHAAMGLAVMKHFEEILAQRERTAKLYRDRLSVDQSLSFQTVREGNVANYSYMPVLFESEERLLKVVEALNQESIFPRRYFHPSLNNIEILSNNSCPVSESIASRILCLPSYYGLGDDDVENVANIIVKC